MHENRETSETPAVEADGRSAGEGLGRTARMYVSEESDRGIVPRNHSNKDGFPSAEDGEGRLRIKENTFPFDTHPTLSGIARVPRWASVRTSGMLGRYSSAIRAACANKRSCGSVRGCALKAHGVQLSEMMTAAKPSQQPRTESCVVASTALRSVDREVVGRNNSERQDSPEIDRVGSGRPNPPMGKAEFQRATRQVLWNASGVRTAGMQPRDTMGTRESCQDQA